jgi:hypothetical protein
MARVGFGGVGNALHERKDRKHQASATPQAIDDPGKHHPVNPLPVMGQGAIAFINSLMDHEPAIT